MKNRKQHSRFSSTVDLDKGLKFNEKVQILFKDVTIEGKKIGYERGSKEYGKSFRAVEKEFEATKDLMKKQKNTYKTQAEDLSEIYIRLKQLSADLKRQVHSKMNDVSNRYDISVHEIRGHMEAGTLMSNNSIIFHILGAIYSRLSVIGMIYTYKRNKLYKAEQEGYLEAQGIYKNKIAKLNAELERLRKNASEDVQELLSLIAEMLDIIAKEHSNIAELQILLHEGDSDGYGYV